MFGDLLRIATNPYVYGPIIGVTAITLIVNSLAHLFPRNKQKLQYLAVGVTTAQVLGATAMVDATDATEPQKRWIVLHVLAEVDNQIHLGVAAREKAMSLMMGIRSIPLVTGLLTALAAQVESIRAPSLFAVNVLMMATSISIEVARTQKHYNNWAYARETANRLYAALARYLSLESQFDNFSQFCLEIDAIANAYDATMGVMIATELETGSVEIVDKEAKSETDV